MVNEEITNTKPHNEYVKSISGETLNPCSDEGKLNGQMNMQHVDSLVNDAPIRGRTNETHKDSTDSLPKGYSEVSSEKPVFEGTLHESMIGGKKGEKQDYKSG